MKVHKNQHGFTILELLIATAVFSVILLLATYGLLQVGRMFYKGVTISRTQETARAVMEEITQNIQFSGQDVVETDEISPAPGTPARFCMGSRRYSYITGRMFSESPTGDQVRHALVVDEDVTNCANEAPQDFNAALTDSSKELLQPQMRLAKLEVRKSGEDGLYRVTVRIITGENDVINNPDTTDASCVTGGLSSQFCA